MNDAIRKMIETPGRYEVYSLAAPGLYALVEVESNGTVHQLNPRGERDGVLSPDGWGLAVIVRPAKENGAS